MQYKRPASSNEGPGVCFVSIGHKSRDVWSTPAALAHPVFFVHYYGMARLLYSDAHRLRTALGRLLCALVLSLLTTDASKAQPAPPAPNRVLRLDGNGDYVQLPSHIFDDLEKATLEAWVKWESFAWYEQWFGYGSGAKNQVLAINLGGKGARLQFFLYDRDQELHLTAADTDLEEGRWVHMAAVSGAGGMRLYLNGVEVARNDYPGSFAAVGNGEQVYLGRSNWQGNLDFMGDIDEVRVWDTERTGEQIRAAMHRRLEGDEPGLAALWNFDGACAEGEIISDQSGHGHRGRLVGQAHCRQVELPERHETPVRLHGRILDESGTALNTPFVFLFKDGERLMILQEAKPGTHQSWLFPPGRYDLMAFLGEQDTWREGIELSPGQEALAVDLILRPAISLRGRVVHLDGTPQHGIVTQALTADGRVAQSVQTDAEGHFRFVHLRPGPYAVRFHLPDRFAYATAEGHTHSAAEAGVFHIDGDRTATVPPVRLAPFRHGTWRVYDALDGLKANAITDIPSAADGTLWLATRGSGVWTFDGQTFANLTSADGLAHDEVNGVTITAADAVWLATQGGATRYKDGQMTSLTSADGLVHDAVNSICEVPGDALFFATQNGVSRRVGDRFEPIPLLDSALAGVAIAHIGRDRDGALWLSANRLGLWRYADDQIQRFNARHGLNHPAVSRTLEARDGALWVAK